MNDVWIRTLGNLEFWTTENRELSICAENIRLRCRSLKQRVSVERRSSVPLTTDYAPSSLDEGLLVLVQS